MITDLQLIDKTVTAGLSPVWSQLHLSDSTREYFKPAVGNLNFFIEVLYFPPILAIFQP